MVDAVLVEGGRGPLLLYGATILACDWMYYIYLLTESSSDVMYLRKSKQKYSICEEEKVT